MKDVPVSEDRGMTLAATGLKKLSHARKTLEKEPCPSNSPEILYWPIFLYALPYIWIKYIIMSYNKIGGALLA